MGEAEGWMQPERFTGSTGRAETDIGQAGRVEIDGHLHDAVAAGPPIPAGGPVVVTGFRLVGAGGYVLSVRPRAEGEPDVSPRSPHTSSGDAGGCLLFFGQIASGVACAAAAICLYAVAGRPDFVLSLRNDAFRLAAGAACAAAYSAAMFVVFGRVLSLPPRR